MQSGSFDGWVTRPALEGTLSIHNVGADGSSSSILHSDRDSLNKGPGQFLDTNCFVAGEYYEINAKIMILDEDGNFTTCDKTAGWNDEDFCPLFSIWGRDEKEHGWGDFWLDVPNNDTSDWVEGEFNTYTAIFKLNDEIMTAIEASFMFRGLRIGAQILVDSVSFTPYNHVPDYVPPGWGEEAYDFFVSSSTFDVSPYSQPTW